jgi:multidrug transporter EmrE-like cation transporter
MDRRLAVTRAVALTATLALLPTVVFASRSRVFLAVAVLEAAVLAVSTAYAVYLGLYRFPR